MQSCAASAISACPPYSNGNFLSQPNSLHTVLISFIHSVQNTLSVKLYQSVPSPMIIISTFRPTHQIKTNGTERKLKVSGRKSRLLFPSGPTPQNTAFSASQLQHRFFNPAPRVQGNGATSCTFRSAAVRSIRKQKASRSCQCPLLFHTPRFEHAPDKY